MATRFWLPHTATPAVSPTFSAEWDVTAEAIRSTLARAPIFQQGSQQITVAETETVNVNVLGFQAVSRGIGAGEISGTVKAVLRCKESIAGANLRSQLRVYLVSGDGLTVRGVLLEVDLGALSNEWHDAGSGHTKFFPVGLLNNTLTAVTAEDGDRIVAEFGYRAHNTTATSVNGVLTITSEHARVDHAESEGVPGEVDRPWIEFSADIPLPAPINAYETELRAKGVKSWWPLDETSGTVLRDAMQRWDMAIFDAPLLGQAGPTPMLSAISTDGVDDFTNANPTNIELPAASSVVWLKTDLIGQGHGRGGWLLGEGGPHGIWEQFDDGGTHKWNWHYRDDLIVARDLPLNAIVSDQWEFLAWTVDATGLRVYQAVDDVVTELASDLVNATEFTEGLDRLGASKGGTDTLPDPTPFGEYSVSSPAFFHSALTVTDLQDIYDAAQTAGGVAGTSTVTQDDQTSTASGIVGEPSFTGMLDVTGDDQVSTASGAVVNTGIGGSLAVTQETQVLAASGTVTAADISGTLAVTQNDQTLVAQTVIPVWRVEVGSPHAGSIEGI